jgi:hypothetical protein
VTPQSSLFYSCKDQLSYQEADNELSFLLSGSLLPLGSAGNPVVISDDNDEVEGSLSHSNYREA